MFPVDHFKKKKANLTYWSFCMEKAKKHNPRIFYEVVLNIKKAVSSYCWMLTLNHLFPVKISEQGEREVTPFLCLQGVVIFSHLMFGLTWSADSQDCYNHTELQEQWKKNRHTHDTTQTQPSPFPMLCLPTCKIKEAQAHYMHHECVCCRISTLIN